MKKRILSVLIALCILTAFIPGGVRAYNGIKYGDYLYYEFTENSDAIWITDCDELAEGEIVIPAQIDGLPVIAIGDYAFSFDNRMVFADEMPTISIAIPDSITNIGKDVFRGAVIKSINVDAGNKYYSSENGNLYNKNKQTLITYAEKQEHEFIIPTGVTNISDRAFEGCSLESIKIPDGVTRIGRSAFSYCGSLVNINIPDSMMRIEDSAFFRCYNLKDIDIPDRVTSIGNDTFFYCASLTNITIPTSIKSIGDSAFSYCDNLTDVYYGGTQQEWSNIVIGSGNQCLLNAKVHYNSTPTEPEEINFSYKIDYDGTVTIIGCNENVSGAITIPDKINGLPVISIGSGAFEGCTSLTSVTISDGVVVIGRYAFGGCTSLTDIKIPKSVTIIALGAFSDTGYYNDESNWNNDVLYIGNHLIEAREEISTNYTIKNGTRVIAESAFSGCENLKAITIPDGVVYIDDYAFRDCTSLTDVKIPNGVTEISMGSFYGCSSLTSVTIPESLIYIGEAAFRNCPSLTDIYYDGSEADWLNIERFGADDLFNTKIHYGKRGPLKVKPVEPIIDGNAGTIEIPVTVTETERSDELNEVELYIAEYDDYGCFIGITLGEKSAIEDDTITVKGKIPKINNYKIMLWDGNQAPLMSAIEGGTKSDRDSKN